MTRRRKAGTYYLPTENRDNEIQVDEENNIIHRHAFEHEQNCENWDAQDRKAGKKSGYEDRSGVKSHVFDMNSTTIRRWDLAGDAADYIYEHRRPESDFRRTPEGLRAFWLPFNEFAQINYLYKETPNWPGLDLPYYLAPDGIRLILSISTASYGGLHASAWNAHFPSKYERIIWLCCCLLIAVSGFAVFVWYSVKSLAMIFKWYHFRNKWICMFDNLGLMLLGVLVLYFLARTFLVVEAFISLRNFPKTVYQTPVWTQLIPHL
jgi:hypothetical protein